MLEKTFKYKKSTLPFAAPHALHVLHEHVSGHWHSAPQLHSVSVHPQGLLQMAHAQSVVLHWQVSPQLHAPLAQVQFVSINQKKISVIIEFKIYSEPRKCKKEPSATTRGALSTVKSFIFFRKTSFLFIYFK